MKNNVSRRGNRAKYWLAFCGITFVLIAGAVLLTQCAVRKKASGPFSFSSYGLEIPRTDHPQFLVVCEEGRYMLWYDTLYRQAAWVAHRLTRSDLEKSGAERRNRFVVCRTVRTNGWPYATDADYTRSGYDRGHLVPSADRVCSQAENDATFRLSNITPQAPRLNRGLWGSLEAEVRRMAERLDTLWIVTGSELKPECQRIGTNRVGVPGHFFKAILARDGQEYMAIAFRIPNTDPAGGSFWDYAVPVDEAEELSGFDFFSNLPDALEQRIEARCDTGRWKRVN